MGRLVDELKQKCENCNRIALPLSIAGNYISGEKLYCINVHSVNISAFMGNLGSKVNASVKPVL